MTLKRIEIMLTGSSAKAIDAMEDTSVAATEATDEMTDKYERMGERVGAIFEAIGAKGEELGIAGSSGLSTFGAKLQETEGKSRSFMGSMVSLGNKMILGLGAGAAVVGYEGVKIAMQVDAAQASLQGALRASHESWSQNASVIAKVEGAQRNLGFTDQDTLQALAQGVIATGSLTKARHSLALASDLARYKNISLSSSELMIDRALAGNLRGIKQLGLNLNVTAGGAHAVFNAQQALTVAQTKARDIQIQYGDQVYKGGKDWLQYQEALQAVQQAHLKLDEVQSSSSTIMSALNEKLKDQGELYAQTLPGKIEVFKSKIDHLEGDVGNWLIPKLESAGAFVGKVFDDVEKNPVLLGAGAAVIGLPIIAALGSFARLHIISPLLKLGGIFKDGPSGIVSNLKSLFTGKSGPAGQLTASADALKVAGDSLQEAANSLKGSASAQDTAAGEEEGAAGAIDTTAGRTATGGTAIAGGGLGKVLVGAAAAFGAVQLADYLSHASWTGKAEDAVYSFLGGQKITNLNSLPFGVGATLEKQAGNKLPNTGPFNRDAMPDLPFGIGATLEKQIRAGEDSQRSMVSALAKTLEGKDKTPQAVRLLDEVGLGKLIGTSAGNLVGHSLTAAMKDQTHNWNLPYVIAQGFGKADKTLGSSLQSQTKTQDSTNRDFAKLVEAFMKYVSGGSSNNSAFATAIAQLESAASRIPTHITVTGGLPPRRKR